MGERLKIGISSCLLGNEVRYDADHSRNDCILNSMGELFELIPFCPEVAIGLSIPRPPINLVSVNGDIHVRGVNDPSHDVTDALSSYALSITEQLNVVSGYIFKSRSPSCGLANVNVYDGKTNEVVGASAGQFAKIIMQKYPKLPVEDETRLSNKEIRGNFIQRALAYSNKNN